MGMLKSLAGAIMKYYGLRLWRLFMAHLLSRFGFSFNLCRSRLASVDRHVFRSPTYSLLVLQVFRASTPASEALESGAIPACEGIVGFVS